MLVTLLRVVSSSYLLGTVTFVTTPGITVNVSDQLPSVETAVPVAIWSLEMMRVKAP